MKQIDKITRRASLFRDLQLYRADLTAAEAEYERCSRLVSALGDVDAAHLGLNDDHVADARRAMDRAWAFAAALGARVAAIEAYLNELL